MTNHSEGSTHQRKQLGLTVHLLCRALFGTEEECITSLAAWQHMCTEARWVGRALFDAEEMVLRYTQ